MPMNRKEELELLIPVMLNKVTVHSNRFGFRGSQEEMRDLEWMKKLKELTNNLEKLMGEYDKIIEEELKQKK
jgi:hypothetical protein